MLSNPVVISIIVLLALSLLRINVIISLVIAALTAGFIGDLGLTKTIETFTGGLGGGAEVAMNYAMLGAFAIAISKSGITDLIAYKIITKMNKTPTAGNLTWFKYFILRCWHCLPYLLKTCFQCTLLLFQSLYHRCFQSLTV